MALKYNQCNGLGQTVSLKRILKKYHSNYEAEDHARQARYRTLSPEAEDSGDLRLSRGTSNFGYEAKGFEWHCSGCSTALRLCQIALPYISHCHAAHNRVVLRWFGASLLERDAMTGCESWNAQSIVNANTVHWRSKCIVSKVKALLSPRTFLLPAFLVISILSVFGFILLASALRMQ